MRIPDQQLIACSRAMKGYRAMRPRKIKTRTRIAGWASALAAGLVSGEAVAQYAEPPAEPVAMPVQSAPAGGPIHRLFAHIGSRLQDKMIGYPDQFSEPPLGFYVNEHIALMQSRADMHKFILYRSDFMEGEANLSPIGAQRLSLMAARLGCWLGPLTVEWTPDKPGLADMRRTNIVAMLQKAGLPVVPERVVVGPSPYPGLLGADAQNNYGNLIFRDQAAAQNYSLTPTSTANFGSGAR
jgi:hypothetical protein